MDGQNDILSGQRGEEPNPKQDFPELFIFSGLADVTANLTIDLGKGIPQEAARRGQRDLPCGAVEQAKAQLLPPGMQSAW